MLAPGLSGAKESLQAAATGEPKRGTASPKNGALAPEGGMMNDRRRALRMVVAAAGLGLLLVGLTSAPASADVDIVGDTNVGVKAVSTVSTNYPKPGASVTGTSKITFYYHVLGLPLPNTGYYVNSFPWIQTARPTLVDTNHRLDSKTYAQFFNPVTDAYAWEVHGSDGFTGDMTVKIIGSAKTDAKGSGYFYAGTYTCKSWSGCRNADAISLVKVS